jgi:hypothetical protein
MHLSLGGVHYGRERDHDPPRTMGTGELSSKPAAVIPQVSRPQLSLKNRRRVKGLEGQGTGTTYRLGQLHDCDAESGDVESWS